MAVDVIPNVMIIQFRLNVVVIKCITTRSKFAFPVEEDAFLAPQVVRSGEFRRELGSHSLRENVPQSIPDLKVDTRQTGLVQALCIGENQRSPTDRQGLCG